ncbi:signal recognition particle subunit srp68 [Elasticomyces elasticus]|nr:signal recognition particle subunit srp68 [Elasticomyces elasticus]
MHMKSTHAEDSTGQAISRSIRSHIVSRLNKAAKSAEELVTLLRDQTITRASDTDVLEAKAYLASITGAEEFEKQAEGQRSADAKASKDRWQKCLRSYSEARVIYAALLKETKKDVFREILANTVDPTIRYAAYQAYLPRTVAIATISKKNFPPQHRAGVENVPNTIAWRSREANIVDASIGAALAAVSAAELKLSIFLKSNPNASLRDKAAAYDDALIPSQDAADATRRAIEELGKERADEGDPRLQDLRVTSLAVNYELVSWRVGRNRVLIGIGDGVALDEQKPKKPKRPRKDGKEWPDKEESKGRKLVRLRERVVLYDSIIQSIDSIKDLRGAMRDTQFVEELEGKRAYFQALKCANIAHSHALMSSPLNALALYARAQALSSRAVATAVSTNGTSLDSPPKLDIHRAQAQHVHETITNLVHRHRALVDLAKFQVNSATAASKHMTSAAPLVQRLHEYPAPGVQVDLSNLVTYPPRIEPVPVKPLFFDVAWNYIEYPGQATKAVDAGDTGGQEAVVNGVEEKPQEKKRGWFGFGR